MFWYMSILEQLILLDSILWTTKTPLLHKEIPTNIEIISEIE